MDERLATLDESSERQYEVTQLLHVAIEHRLMHVETLSYMLHQLPTDRKYRRDGQPASGGRMRHRCWRNDQNSRGKRDPGAPAIGGVAPFGWDNEFEEHTVDVPAFLIDERKR